MRQDIPSYEHARLHLLSIIKTVCICVRETGTDRDGLFFFCLIDGACAVERKKVVLLSDELSICNAENPVVPFIQGGTVADADDRCAGERRQKTVHLFFCFFVHGTGGFVKEDPFWFSEEHADKSQFLLFP